MRRDRRVGQVPTDFDAVTGEPEPVQAKGPLLMIGADDVWEWTGANGSATATH